MKSTFKTLLLIVGLSAAVAALSQSDFEATKARAEAGDVNAQSSLGRMYFNGTGVKQNDQEALKWFRLAAEQGDASGQNGLGVTYDRGTVVARDYQEAVKWYHLAAEQGLDRAQHNLAGRYYNGEGVPQNHTEAVKWYRLAAEQGYALAQYSLGIMYINGFGVPQNYSEAIKWGRLAAEQGNADAQNLMGDLYYTGEGVNQNSSEAARWYRLAADQGVALAQSIIGFMYQNGIGVTQSKSEAVNWYTLAAEQGYALAQFNMGVMYENGEGVAQNYQEAVKWFRLAAEQGDAIAQNQLGGMYYVGELVPQNYSEAAKWYRLAAEQGHAESSFILGSMYISGGFGVAQNDQEALNWFTLAAEQGNADAREALEIGAAFFEAINISAMSLRSSRNPEYVVLEESKRPDGSLHSIKVIDINSVRLDSSVVWGLYNYLLVDGFEGRPQVEGSIEGLSPIRHRERLESISSDDILENVYYKIMVEDFSFSSQINVDLQFGNDVDFPNLFKRSNSQRISMLLDKWFSDEALSNSVHYDIIALLGLRRQAAIRYVDLTIPLERRPLHESDLDAARDQFSILITSIAAVSGTSILDVINYFGLEEKNKYLTTRYSFMNKNITFSQKAREDILERYFGVHFYNGNRPQRNNYTGFPHDMTPQEMLGDYFPTQFGKYISELPDLIKIRDNMERELAEAEKSRSERAAYAASPEGQREAEQRRLDSQRQAARQAEQLAREYPYYALVSCGMGGQHMNIMACFGGDVTTDLELRNGSDYKLYQVYEVGGAGEETGNGLLINLRENFELKAQNSHSDLVLGVKIFDRSGKTLFEQQVRRFGVIGVSN